MIILFVITYSHDDINFYYSISSNYSEKIWTNNFPFTVKLMSFWLWKIILQKVWKGMKVISFLYTEILWHSSNILCSILSWNFILASLVFFFHSNTNYQMTRVINFSMTFPSSYFFVSFFSIVFFIWHDKATNKHCLQRSGKGRKLFQRKFIVQFSSFFIMMWVTEFGRGLEKLKCIKQWVENLFDLPAGGNVLCDKYIIMRHHELIDNPKMKQWKVESVNSNYMQYDMAEFFIISQWD